MKRKLLAAGREPGTVHVVGNPEFDEHRGRAPLVPRDSRTVLFAQQPQRNYAVELKACEHLIRICADELRCRLLVRPHPRGYLKSEMVRNMAQATTAPQLVETVDNGEIADYFARASVLVTYYSTSTYHAAIRGLPLVLLNWVSPEYELDAPSFGAALAVNSPGELAAALRLVLDDQKCREDLYRGAEAWLGEHVGSLDGNAARRAAAVIASLSRRSPSEGAKR